MCISYYLSSPSFSPPPSPPHLPVLSLLLLPLLFPPQVKRLTEQLGLEFSKFCYQGFWFAPEMDLVRHSMDYAQKDVDGLVEMELYKGNITVTGRSSDKTLYSADLASMDIEDAGEGFDYNPKDSQGFIRINAVRLKMYSNRTEKGKKGKK